jgi:CO dehydrogenase maturation factor
MIRMNDPSPLKGFTIVVAGKGGTGKTLVSALLVRDQRKHGAVLAIDADPDANLPETLGVHAVSTVGQAREKVLAYRTRRNENRTVTAEQQFEQHLMESMVETEDFDLIVMGRSEGEGCYCAVNHILRGIIDTQARNYPTVVIDSEAGLEHISRRTARDVDVMLVVTDASARGISTARRVAELAGELRVDFGRLLVLANKVTDQTQPIIEKHAEESGLELIGFLPFDHQVVENDALGKPIWELPEDHPVVRAAREVFARLDVIREEKMGRVLCA